MTGGTNHAPSMSADDAASLYTDFATAGIRCWVMGGWGVDALLGRETRAHHDLDLLVAIEDLGRFLDQLALRGFTQKLVWDGENRWVDVGGVPRPTAFVQVDSDGREVDVHVIELRGNSPATALCDVPWQFDHVSLDTRGVIAGCEVRCVSVATQLKMHTGYDLPPQHLQDAALLRRLSQAARPRS